MLFGGPEVAAEPGGSTATAKMLILAPTYVFKRLGVMGVLFVSGKTIER